MRAATIAPVTVHEFGGAALHDAAARRRVVALLGATSGRRVVVTSALSGVTDALRDVPLRQFLAQLETLDAAWAERVGLVGVALGSSRASLVITGPGAGPLVTAAGMLNDLVRVPA